MKVLNREGIIRMGGRSQGGGGVSVGGGSGSVAGLASEAWVEENYISKAFFNRLFTIHSASSVIDPNDPDEEQTIDSIEALVGLWTEQYLSALGQGSGGGGGGGITLNDPLDAINSAGLSDPVTAGSALVWYGGAWTYSPSARLQVAGLNSSAAVSVTGSVTATSFVRQGGTSSMFLKADGSVDTTVYAAQDWVNQNFITIAFFETLFNAVDTNGTKVNANTTTGIDSIKAMFGFWTNQYLSALGQGSGGGGGGVTLNQPLSSINSAGLGAPSVSGSTLVWNGSTWTYSSSIGDTKNTAGSSQQPSGVQLYLIGASAQATWGVTYSNSGCYIGTDGYLYSGGSKVLTSSAGFVTGVSINNGNPISPVNGVVALTDIMTTAGGTMTGSLSISGSGSHLSVGGNIGAQGTITSQDYITATGYKVPSGTSAGFLKADGSVDTTSYSTSDTLNTTGATAQPNSVIYLVGAGSYNSTYAVTYTNSGCYISADGYLYSGGVKVITSTSGLVSGISIGGDTPIEPTNGIVQIPAYPVNTDTLNTAGSTQKPSNVALYLVGASAQATYGQTYSDSGCYISADGYLYSGGVRVLTSGNTVQTITINNGTPISPTNGNVNINCVTSVTSSTVTTALGYTPAASSDLANYLPLSGGILTTSKAKIELNAAGCGIKTLANTKIASIGSGSSGPYQGAEYGILQLYHNNTEPIRFYTTGDSWINNSSSFGIGTDSPKYKLDVRGSIAIGGPSSYGIIGCIYSSTDNTLYNYIKISSADSTNGDIIYSAGKWSGSSHIAHNFKVGIAGGSEINAMCIMNTTGRVGIGTTSPSYILDVNGAVGITGNTTIGTGYHLSVGGNIGAQGTLTAQGYATAQGYKVPNGTSAGFLKADGSVDTTSYTSNTGTVTGISIGSGTPYTPTNGIVGLPAYPTNTDTTNTAGVTNLTGTKLFIIGGSSQTDGIRTYSNSNCYIGTDNCLYSGGSKVLTTSETGFLPLSGGQMSGMISSPSDGWLLADQGGKRRVLISNTGFIFAYLSNSDRLSTWIDGYELHFRTGTNADERLTILYGGNVGIGTASPSYKLDINGSMMCSGLNSSGGGSIATDLTVSGHVYVEKIGNGMTNMRFNSNGNVGIGVNNTSGYLLQVNGACAGTSWTNLSDMRQKNYVEDENIELWQVASAPVFKFTWKNNAFGTDLHVGSSAQYWQTIVPEAVTIDGLGNLGLQYDVVALLAAITTAKKVQEHERRIEELERENKVLWNMIASLKAA